MMDWCTRGPSFATSFLDLQVCQRDIACLQAWSILMPQLLQCHCQGASVRDGQRCARGERQLLAAVQHEHSEPANREACPIEEGSQKGAAVGAVCVRHEQ